MDAVVISTPDHWHCLIAIDAVEAGKDVYLQKPASLTIAEGRALSDAVQRTGRIFQIGSQQRSTVQFRYAAELVRNGRIGQLKTVEVGLPGDPSGDDEPEMPVPKNLNYDMWLGSTPVVYYTEKRVHPQVGYDRPGWLRCEQFGAGMITGWGAHHIDSAHWGMDTELTGPVEIWGTRRVPEEGPLGRPRPLPDGGALRQRREDDRQRRLPQRHQVHRNANGWIFVSRGQRDGSPRAIRWRSCKDASALAASDPKIITSVIGPDEINLPREHRPPRQLARGREVAPAAHRPGRGRAPLLLGLPAPPHRHEAEAEALLGSGAGALQERRRGERDAVAAAAFALRDRPLLSSWRPL